MGTIPPQNHESAVWKNEIGGKEGITIGRIARKVICQSGSGWRDD
jgi:hypothetical protein